jgi:hypothetical protein
MQNQEAVNHKLESLIELLSANILNRKEREPVSRTVSLSEIWQAVHPMYKTMMFTATACWWTYNNFVRTDVYKEERRLTQDQITMINSKIDKQAEELKTYFEHKFKESIEHADQRHKESVDHSNLNRHSVEQQLQQVNDNIKTLIEREYFRKK